MSRCGNIVVGEGSGGEIYRGWGGGGGSGGEIYLFARLTLGDHVMSSRPEPH
jgi:hypothetical protein